MCVGGGGGGGGWVGCYFWGEGSRVFGRGFCVSIDFLKRVAASFQTPQVARLSFTLPCRR